MSGDDLNRIAEAGWRPPSAKTVSAGTLSSLRILSSYKTFRPSGKTPVISRRLPRPLLSSCRPEDDRRRRTDHYDIGQATMAMMIAATDLGIGAGHSSIGMRRPTIGCEMISVSASGVVD